MAERDDEIRARAYAIWAQEGYPEGRSLDHWLQAEAEIAVAAPVVAGEDGKPPAAPELPKAA